MARGKKTGGKDFVKGHTSPGPGRPPTPPELKEARRLTKVEFETLCNKYLWLPTPLLEQAHESPDLTGIESLIVSILLMGRKAGDPSRAEFFLQRLLGKVKDQVEVSTPKPFVIERGDGSQVVMGAKVEKEDE